LKSLSTEAARGREPAAARREDAARAARRACPACGAGGARGRGRKNDLEIASCEGCGTLYALSAPGAGGDYDDYYDEANLSVPPFVERRLDEIVAGFAPFRKGNRLLDVGCGAGSLLEAARRAGWDAEGVEVSLPSVEHVRARGFEVFYGELAAARFPAASFDVVTASEILEHLPEPQELLREIARVVRPGGLFWGTTPHGRGLSARALGVGWSAVHPPEHLQLFSLGGLRALLASAGFRRVRLTSRGVNPFELWRALRRRGDTAAARAGGAGGPEVEHFDRVATGYQLNEALAKGRARRLAKGALNALLGAARCGDSIKIWAVK
jgi:SAM-dependent methyltransferase